MKVTYVEAMTRRDAEPECSAIDTKAVREALVIARKKSKAAATVALADDVDDLLLEIESHANPRWGSMSIGPLSSGFTVAQDLERAGFLVAEEVAIIRLSDLRALIAKAERWDEHNDAMVPPCAEKVA